MAERPSKSGEEGQGPPNQTAATRAERRREQIARRKAERQDPSARGSQMRSLPDWGLLVPAVVGLLLAGYLSFVAWSGGKPIACGVGSACDLVQGSRFATVFGVPVAAWGALAYAALIGIAWRVGSAQRHTLWALAIATPGLAISLYLTAVSIFVIGATCLWCLASLVLMGACFIAALFSRPAGIWPSSRNLAAVAGTALLAVGALHLHYQSSFEGPSGPEDPRLRALAQHLADSGAIFYGADWCPHCQDQKAFFGNSAHRLPYVECSPNGPRSPQAEVCRKQGIRSYPTWVIDGERHLGFREPKQLAELSEFEGPDAVDGTDS